MLSSQLLRKLVRQFVQEELTSCKLKVLLIHTVTTFEAGHDHGWWTLKESHIWIKLHRQLAAHLGSTIVTERWQLVRFCAFVEQNAISGRHSIDHGSLRATL